MGTVAHVVIERDIRPHGVASNGAPLEALMRDADASVQHVSEGPFACAVVVDVGLMIYIGVLQLCLRRDTGQAPGLVGFLDERGKSSLTIRLDRGDLEHHVNEWHIGTQEAREFLACKSCHTSACAPISATRSSSKSPT